MRERETRTVSSLYFVMAGKQKAGESQLQRATDNLFNFDYYEYGQGVVGSHVGGMWEKIRLLNWLYQRWPNS